jgi:ATP-dependent metalloprotease
LAAALVEYETLNLDEVRTVLKGEKLDRSIILGEKLVSEAEKRGDVPVVEVESI